MQVRVHARNHASLDEATREAAEKKVNHAARFWDDEAMIADVEVIEERNPRLADERFRVQITTNAAQNIVRVEAAGPTPEAALDIAVDKFEHQLRRLKEKVVDRRRRQEKNLNPAPPTAEEEVPADEPRIVKVKQFVMKPMTPEEAALQMEMLGHSFFFFHNAETDLPSVLYRRRDGSYGLIEPA